MIVVMKKSNIVLVALILLLVIAIYSLNLGRLAVTGASGGRELAKVVMLDPGHGGEDPGAESPYTGITEKELNLDIAKKLRQLLEQDGFKVIMTREEDRLEYEPGTKGYTPKRKQDLLRRKKMMDEAGASIVVSIHMNKIKETQYYGAQVFFSPESAESQKLAVCIQKSLKETVDPNNKREALAKKPVKGQQIIILRDLKTTTAIVECGFLSNSEEEQKLRDEAYRGKLAAAIKEGIKKYFEQ